jgi:hypothetical protein
MVTSVNHFVCSASTILEHLTVPEVLAPYDVEALIATFVNRSLPS